MLQFVVVFAVVLDAAFAALAAAAAAVSALYLVALMLLLFLYGWCNPSRFYKS